MPAIVIAGLAIQTSNTDPRQAMADIGALWQLFYAEDMPKHIQPRLSDDVYCLYTHYETDHTGAYTTVLGFAVLPEAILPPDLTKVQIPAGLYRRYVSVGKLPDCVAETWMHIWQTATDRSFVADYDVYGPAAQDPQQASVYHYISVKATPQP